MVKDFFPQGIATGDAFLGRDEEMTTLRNNINSGHHTLLIAPRRYGKTSLALNVLKKLKIPTVEINFFLAVTEKAVERKIIAGVEELIKKITSKPENLIRIMQNFLKKAHKKWTFSFKGISLEFTPDKEDDPANNILTILQLAEHILSNQKQKAVLFLDEVQEFESLKEGKAIEGAIREFAQKSKYLVFMFSGSNRRLLKNMFDDKAAPLFELCDRIQLNRLETDIYKYYLQSVAKKTWKTTLLDEVLDTIISLSQRHPRRIYNLCHVLWEDHGKSEPPKSRKAVELAWEKVLNHRLKDIRYALYQSLNAGQIKVLSLVASGLTTEFTGKIGQQKTALSAPTIMGHLKTLEDLDYLERNKDGQYNIIDPIIYNIVKRYDLDNLE